MGWSSGVSIFDRVAGILVGGLESDDCDLVEYSEYILLLLIKALRDNDWDTESDSRYWDHEIVGTYLGNTFEDDELEEN
jgi:hypothetical protein